MSSRSESLNRLTVDELKQLAALLPAAERPTRKAELVSLVEGYLSGARLRELWGQLDDLQQKAVSETLYDADGAFDAGRFKAKYGGLPNFGTKTGGWSYREMPSLLRLFVYREERFGSYILTIPPDLKQELLSFVPPPAAPSLRLTDELPEFFELSGYEYEAEDEGEDDGLILIAGREAYRISNKPPRGKATVEQIPLLRRETERDAQQDLQTVLRLIDKGRVMVSDKTSQSSAATVKEIGSLLRDGDFYPESPKKQSWEQEVGPIKAFAWPLLVQAGRLAELHGKKLALTKAGRQALGASPAGTLRLVWQRWLKAKLLDEFNRIETIKGQHGKGKRTMTAPESRRTVIAEALRHCPVGGWVKFDDFSRFMQAAGLDFEVTREPWDLYIADPHYGSLGHSGYHDWDLLEGRYALCLLFEYAATLGLIDVAYVEPDGARPDYGELWGTDDLTFLSRYDGLLYFRVNPLGAYCLGLTEDYTPSRIEARASLTVLPSLRVKVEGVALAPDEALLLEAYAEKESDAIWHLNREKALSAVESGHRIAELREFLQARDEQPLPETVESFIATTERRARSLVNQGAALLIECADAEIAAAVAAHERVKNFCRRAGERHLVIPIDAEDQFRKALHALGYGMPRS